MVTDHPNHWTYTFGEDTPEELRTFSLTPIVDGGQSSFFAHGPQYSEGAALVIDAEGNEIGRGFGESVNYADTVDLMTQPAGLPGTDDMVVLLQDSAPSRKLQSDSMAYVLRHQEELNEVIANCLGISRRGAS